jgi:hypothetical protein
VTEAEPIDHLLLSRELLFESIDDRFERSTASAWGLQRWNCCGEASSVLEVFNERTQETDEWLSAGVYAADRSCASRKLT